MRLAAGLCPDPLRVSQCSPRPPSWILGVSAGKRGEGKGREEKGEGERRKKREEKEGRERGKKGRGSGPPPIKQLVTGLRLLIKGHEGHSDLTPSPSHSHDDLLYLFRPQCSSSQRVVTQSSNGRSAVELKSNRRRNQCLVVAV